MMIVGQSFPERIMVCSYFKPAHYFFPLQAVLPGELETGCKMLLYGKRGMQAGFVCLFVHCYFGHYSFFPIILKL